MNGSKTNWWELSLRVLFTLSIAYILLSLVLMFLQRRMLYFPTKLTPAQEARLAAENGFVPWRDPAGQIIGWELPAKGRSVGAVLIVHGNAGCAVDRSYLADPIHAAARVDVFVLEYPRYGARAGSPGEKSFLAAADEAFATLTNHGPIYVVGESLGNGVAAHLAKTHSRQVSGMVLFMPYNRLTAVARARLPLLPAQLLLWDRFAPEDWLENYNGPIKFVLAGKDEIIPMKFGRRLFDSYNGPKRLQVFLNAHHNDVAEQSPAWWKDVFEFWRQNAKR
ncbi:MAG: alpha/beta hydrolase [Verrucomicrobiia bacterium]